jgi:hypothetical protein
MGTGIGLGVLNVYNRSLRFRRVSPQGYTVGMFIVEYPYFFAAILFLLLWLISFWVIPKINRKDMLKISLITLILGPLVEQMHFTDWWHPHFIFNSFITIEDTLFGFGVGGIIYASYVLLRNKLALKKQSSFTLFQKAAIATLSLFSLFGLFYLFHIHSFWSSLISLFVPILVVSIYDRRMLLPIFLSGVGMVILTYFGYLLTIYLDPAFVSQTYNLSKLSGILVSGIPIEELCWFFFAGMGISAFSVIFEPY